MLAGQKEKLLHSGSYSRHEKLTQVVFFIVVQTCMMIGSGLGVYYGYELIKSYYLNDNAQYPPVQLIHLNGGLFVLSLCLFVWGSISYHWIKKQEKVYDDTETFFGRFWFVMTLIAFLLNLSVVTTLQFWRAELQVQVDSNESISSDGLLEYKFFQNNGIIMGALNQFFLLLSLNQVFTIMGTPQAIKFTINQISKFTVLNGFIVLGLINKIRSFSLIQPYIQDENYYLITITTYLFLFLVLILLLINVFNIRYAFTAIGFLILFIIFLQMSISQQIYIDSKNLMKYICGQLLSPSTDDCKNIFEQVNESIMSNFGCKNKYLVTSKQTQNLPCPTNQQGLMWEQDIGASHKQNEQACLNQVCCGIGLLQGQIWVLILGCVNLLFISSTFVLASCGFYLSNKQNSKRIHFIDIIDLLLIFVVSIYGILAESGTVEYPF